MAKAKRSHKIFVDYLRNYRGSTAVGPYSTRARENAPVAMPLHWDELSVKVKANHYTVLNAIAHLMKRKNDPWEDFFNSQILELKTPKEERT